MNRTKLCASFLSGHMPFSALNEGDLQSLVHNAAVRTFKAGKAILHAGDPPPAHLYVVYTGMVTVSGYPDAVIYLKPGETFGFRSIIINKPLLNSVFAEVNSTCILIPREDFLHALNSNRGFSNHFTNLLDKVLISLYKLPFRETIGIPERYLSATRVKEIVLREPVTCLPGNSIREAVKIMHSAAVGSVVVIREKNQPAGILTMRDLIRVIAEGYDLDRPVSEVMSAPVAHIAEESSLYDAYLAEISGAVNHLVLVDGQNRTRGIVTAKDLMLAMDPAFSISTLGKRISRVSQVDELKRMHEQTVKAIIALFNQGVTCFAIIEIISMVNDAINRKAIQLAEAKLGIDGKVKYAWVASGSGGRREQVLTTDQDNAIIYDDSTDAEGKKLITELGNSAGNILEEVGIPKCKAGHSALNPQWVRSVTEWKKQFDSWLDPEAEEETLMPLTVFLDFRPVYGDEHLADILKAHVFQQELIGVSRFLARQVVSVASPLHFLGRIYYGKKGLSLKIFGLLPIVTGVKALMLEGKVVANSTLERLDLLTERGLLDTETSESLKEAFQTFYALRLKHQLRHIRLSLAPDDFVRPEELSQIEKANLKECLRVVDNFKALLRIRYGLQSEFMGF